MQRLTAIFLTLQLLAFAGGSAFGLHIHCSANGSVAHVHLPSPENETHSQPPETVLEHLFEHGALNSNDGCADAERSPQLLPLAPPPASFRPVAPHVAGVPAAPLRKQLQTSGFSVTGAARAPPLS